MGFICKELIFKDMFHLLDFVCSLSAWPEYGYSKWTLCTLDLNLSKCLFISLDSHHGHWFMVFFFGTLFDHGKRTFFHGNSNNPFCKWPFLLSHFKIVWLIWAWHSFYPCFCTTEPFCMLPSAGIIAVSAEMDWVPCSIRLINFKTLMKR